MDRRKRKLGISMMESRWRRRKDGEGHGEALV
jgi:hypothetical protein